MPQNGVKGKGTNRVWGIPLCHLARYPSPIVLISHETWCYACALLAIDIQFVERFIIFSDIAEKEHDGVRDGVACKNIKGRDGACRDHLVTRITTENIHFLLFQNTDGQDVGWIKATVHLNPFIRLDNGYLHGCCVNRKGGGLLGGVIDEFCLPLARISVLDHEDERGTYQGTGDTKHVQEA